MNSLQYVFRQASPEMLSMINKMKGSGFGAFWRQEMKLPHLYNNTLLFVPEGLQFVAGLVLN